MRFRAYLAFVGILAASGTPAAASERAFVRGPDAITSEMRACGVRPSDAVDAVRFTLVRDGVAVDRHARIGFRVDLQVHRGTAGGCSARIRLLEVVADADGQASEAICGRARILTWDTEDLSFDLAGYADEFAKRCLAKRGDPPLVAATPAPE
ncbi:hypothetical protein WDZ92_24075 [Nostoc sp. NIES-2111]